MRWMVAGLIMVAAATSAVTQPATPVLLRYRMTPGEVLEYRTRMTWHFTAQAVDNEEVIDGREFVVALGEPSTPGGVRLMVLPGGIVVRDQRVHGRTQREIAADRSSNLPGEHDRRAYPIGGLPAFTEPNVFAYAHVVELHPHGAVAIAEIPGTALRHAGLFALLGERIQSLGLPAQAFVEFPQTAVTSGASWTPAAARGRRAPTYPVVGRADSAGRRTIEIKALLATPDNRGGMSGSLWFDPARGVMVEERMALDASWPSGWKTHETLESRLVKATTLSPANLAEVAAQIDQARIRRRDRLDASRRNPGPRDDRTPYTGATGERLVGTSFGGAALRDARGVEVRFSGMAGRAAVVGVGLPVQPAFLQLLGELSALRGQVGEGDLQVFAAVPTRPVERAFGVTDDLTGWLEASIPVLTIDHRVSDLPAWAASVPMTLLVDKNGTIRRAFAGFRDRTELAPPMRALIGKEPPHGGPLLLPCLRPGAATSASLGIRYLAGVPS